MVPTVLPCLLWPGDGANVQAQDVVEFSADEQLRYPESVRVVRVRAPKTARSGAHGRVQVVVGEDIVLVRLASKVLPHILRNNEPLWPFGGSSLLLGWKRGLRMVGLGDSGLLPAGLRGGGATEWHLRRMNVPQPRRRGGVEFGAHVGEVPLGGALPPAVLRSR